MSVTNEAEKKKVIFSAIQPSGTITLGNYLGALRNWIGLQDEYDCIFALADLHTITVRQDPAKFRHNALEAYALLLAFGIDVEKKLILYPKPCSYTCRTCMDFKLLYTIW